MKPQFALLLHQSLKKLDIESHSLHPLIDNITEEEGLNTKQDASQSRSIENTDPTTKTLNITHSVPTISKIAQDNNKSNLTREHHNFSKSRISNELSSYNIQLSFPQVNVKTPTHLPPVNANIANLANRRGFEEYQKSKYSLGSPPKFSKRDSPSKFRYQQLTDSYNKMQISSELTHLLDSKEMVNRKIKEGKRQKKTEESNGAKIQMLQEKLQQDIKLQKLDPEEINK